MSPRTRQRLHELLDLALDAIVEDKADEPKKRKRRALVMSKTPVDAATLERALKAGRKAGFF